MSPEKAFKGVMANDQEVIKNIKDKMIKRTIGSDKFKRSPSEWNDIAVGDIVRLRLYPGLRKLVFAWTMQVFRVTKVIKSKFARRTIAKADGEDLQTQTQTVTTYRVTPVVFEGAGDYKDGVWVKQSEADKYVDDKSARAVQIGKDYNRNLTRAELQKIRRDLPADVAPWSNKKKVKERDITQRKLILKQAEEQQKQIDADNKRSGTRSGGTDKKYKKGQELWIKTTKYINTDTPGPFFKVKVVEPETTNGKLKILKVQYLVDKKTNVVRIDLGKQQDTTYEPKILLPTQFPDQLATNPDKVMLSK